VLLKDAKASTLIALKLTKFGYEKVDVYIAMEFRGLTAALGGDLSLFLGASFLAVIHIVVHSIRLPFKYCWSRWMPIEGSGAVETASGVVDIARTMK